MLDDLLVQLKDFALWILNLLVKILAGLIDFVASILPAWSIDFGSLGTAPTEILQGISWVFPVSTMSYCLTVYVGSVLLYFTLGIITRWAKVTN